jgi:hypothetical protein
MYKRLEANMRPFRQLEERIAGGFSRFMEDEQRSATFISDAFNQWQRLSESYLAGVDWASVQVDQSGSITIGLDTVGAEELQAELGELAQHVALATTPAEYFSRLSLFVGRLSPAVARALVAILIHIILPLVVGVYANI